jgi:diguanylate cyclase (GGDEF)-like protein/putative nucleotidyltransferase with HDIG domain
MRLPRERARASFGDRPRPPRPIVLTIVFGVLLAVVGVTAMSQAVLVSVYASSSALQATVESDLATVRGFVFQGLDQRIATDGTLPSADLARLQGLIATIENKGEILHVELRRPDGTIVASDAPGLSGGRVAPTGAFETALNEGSVQIAITEAGGAEAAPGAELAAPQLLREYMPLSLDGAVVLVVSIWRDAGPILARIEGLRTNVVVVTITAALIASIILYVVFRSAQGRISRQSLALVEASRRDPLTGTLNHGALVGRLAAEIEQARERGVEIGVALIDLDGFRLLNDSHGHVAGDDALLTLSRLLDEAAGEDLLTGRFGPDEFLLASANRNAEGLRPTVQAIVEQLVGEALQYESTERLPITISAGLVTYPQDGASVTTLLSAAVRTLDEAKASGGNSVRIAQPEEEGDSGAASTFDVLKGLVLAVDTKDRYTKRHSEDVARYSMFIAERLGLDDEAVKTIQVAGLLHDIGKIGIPDDILRKPGRLTEAEMHVIRQHVALGDMIVRELPNIEDVRAGIRHHHERWDGDGYLTGLGGEDIPLIARILAVADAFSAMTTTRPYRKALDVKEALDRLGDAAGSQLDERVVRTFLEGLERAANPPLPGSELQVGRLWLPLRQAA